MSEKSFSINWHVENTPLEELGDHLCSTTKNALERNGITDVEKLVAMPYDVYPTMRGIGTKGLLQVVCVRKNLLPKPSPIADSVMKSKNNALVKIVCKLISAATALEDVMKNPHKYEDAKQRENILLMALSDQVDHAQLCLTRISNE